MKLEVKVVFEPHELSDIQMEMIRIKRVQAAKKDAVEDDAFYYVTEKGMQSIGRSHEEES